MNSLNIKYLAAHNLQDELQDSDLGATKKNNYVLRGNAAESHGTQQTQPHVHKISSTLVQKQFNSELES